MINLSKLSKGIAILVGIVISILLVAKIATHHPFLGIGCTGILAYLVLSFTE